MEYLQMEIMHVFSSSDTMVLMHLYPRYGMGVTPTTWYPLSPFIPVLWWWCCHVPSHCLGKPCVRVRIWVWRNIHASYTSMKKDLMWARDGGFVVVLNWQRGSNASFGCSWNPTSSNANTSSCVRFVPISTGHTLGRFGQSKSGCHLIPRID